MKNFLLVLVCFGLFSFTSCGGGSAAVPPPVFPALVITSATPPAGSTQIAYGASGSGFSLTASGGKSPYSWSWSAAAGSSIPPGLSIAAGLISGTPTTAGSYDVIVTVADSQSPPAQKSGNYTIVISIGALNVTSSAPPAGTVQIAYGFSLTASGGVTPYTWSWAAAGGSSLPAGLSLSNGSISGTPTTAGSYNVIVTVTDSESPAVQTSVTYTLVISPPPPLTINSSAPPAGTVGALYDKRNVICRPGSPGCHCIVSNRYCFRTIFGFPLTATGGFAPYMWSWAPGAGSSLPPGLALSGNLISGTPTMPGNFNVTVTVTDSSIPPTKASADYTIIINDPPPPVINTVPAFPSGGLNLPFSYDFTASGYAPLTWSETGALPAGLSFASDGLLSGTPTTTGSFPITVNVADPFGQTASQNLTVQVFAHGFKATGSMTIARASHTSTLLNSGQVLVTGGTDNNGNTLASAELYDPTGGSFSMTGTMTGVRVNHTATLLNSGKVLITGGSDSNGNALTSAELFDPGTGNFTLTGSMTMPRSSHTATLLANGKVLVAGGDGGGTAELYDPVSGTFSATSSMTTNRFGHAATLLTDGRVLITGGINNGTDLATAELFDPSAGTFASTGSMTVEHYLHTATLLNGGGVLIAGGLNNGSPTSVAELFDPSAGSFTATGSLGTARYQQTTTLLVNGQALVAAGTDSTGFPSPAAELFDPNSGTFGGTGSLVNPRSQHRATQLTNGTVLVTGGFSFGGATATAELYQ